MLWSHYRRSGMDCRTRRLALFALLSCFATSGLLAQPVTPGTGQYIDSVGDRFDDQPNWSFHYNLPKSSRNIDKQERGPLAVSSNGRWLEGPHRGTPDLMQIVSTPPGGLRGSDRSLLIQTQKPGVPGLISGKPQQDDIMVQVKSILGQPIPASWSPNCTVRVHLPDYDEWENRTGTSFGFRMDCWGKKPGASEPEQFWPGLFINFRSKTDPRIKKDSAYLTVRGDHQGRDVKGLELAPGWWTLGLSISSNGMCHFYARRGVDDLKEEDRLASYYCYGFRAERMDLFFFNVVSMDADDSSSTPWIIDDPEFFCSMPVALTPGVRQHR